MGNDKEVKIAIELYVKHYISLNGKVNNMM